MEQVVKLTGRIAEVMPIQSGTSQRTGNQWKSQEYLFEYFPWSGATNPSRIVVRIFGEDDITKFNLKQYEDPVTLTLRFAAQKSQDGTRWFNEIRVTNVERPNAQQTTLQPQQDGGTGAAPAAAAPATGFAPVPQPQGTGDANQEGFNNDLPF